MTEREPFARVEGGDGQLFTIFIKGASYGPIYAKEEAFSLCQHLNVAFESAVQARMREAVEAFRERAAGLIEEMNEMQPQKPKWWEYTAAIRALPVEEKR